jgi:beta-galactosidase
MAAKMIRKFVPKRHSSAGKILLLTVVLCSFWTFPAAAKPPAADPVGHAALTIKNGQFLLNGQPYQIISGEMHYERIPRKYWRARLQMAKAMGLNTVTTYVFWNLHEPKPGVYDFSDNLDVAEFVRIAQQEGLNVILRPGPYSCGEWELGGYPAWLLANPKMVLRSNTPAFMEPTTRWMMRLGKELAPLQMDRGGPIIAVQLENEYGSFGDDKVYLEHLRQNLLHAGFTDSLLYTADGAGRFTRGNLPGLLAVATFGTGKARKSLADLKAYQPGMPVMSGEYWVGWFDQWGEKHSVVDQSKIADEYAWMLDQAYSVNLYMFHGGTSFGFMNGANIDGGDYHPDTTSYDYDAPLDESGRPTPLYTTLRNIIARHNKTTALPPIPAIPPTISIPQFKLTESIPLWKTLPAPIAAPQPLPMEMVGQSYGYILYRTQIAEPARGVLIFDHLHDYAQIYLNGTLAGTLDRRMAQDRLWIDVPNKNTQLDVLVENSGRVNYGPWILTERAGIQGSVTLNGNTLTGWQIYSLPMSDPSALPFASASAETNSGPMFYRGKFNLTKTGDTFLDMSSMAKGVVWINGHILGRYWDIGPQRTLYVPGPWLKTGENKVVVFDLTAQFGSSLSGLTAPVMDAEVQTY